MRRALPLVLSLTVAMTTAPAALGAKITGGVPSGPTNQTAPVTITWESSPGGDGTYTVRVDGTPQATNPSAVQFTLPTLPDGSHTITVSEGAADPLAPVADDVATVVVDRTPPTITRVVRSGTLGTNGWYRSHVVIGWNCSADTVDCPTDLTLNAEGSNTAPARTVHDAAGNPATAPAATYNIDTVPPSVTQVVRSGTLGDNDWYTSHVVVGWDCSADTVDCPTDLTLSAEGTNTAPAQTVHDHAGNTAPAPAPAHTYSIDTGDPDLYFNDARVSAASSWTWNGVTLAQGAGSPPIELGTSSAFAVSAECPRSEMSGVASCSVGWNRTPPLTPALLDAIHGTRDGSQLGPRVISLAATDGAGNSSASVVRYTVVDTTAPRTPSASTPDKITNQPKPEFTWLPSEDDGTGVKEYLLRIKGPTSLAPTVPAPAQQPSQYSWMPPRDLTPGSYTWTVTAIDGAGRTASSAPMAFTLDTSAPPQPGLTGPTGITNTRTPTFYATGLAGATFSWTLDRVLPGAASLVQVGGPTTNGTITPHDLTDGQYRLRVRQTSLAGNNGGYISLLFAVDASPPAPPTGLTGPDTTTSLRPTFSWVAGERDATYRWQVLSPAGDVRLGPGTTTVSTVVLPSPLPPGAYVFRVQQIDDAGNASMASDTPFVIAALTPPTPAGATSAGSSAPPPVGTAVRRTTTVPLLATYNAAKLLPRKGRVMTSAPVLRWPKHRGATVYNVQVFRVRGTTFVKVVSAFPRTNAYKVPRAKLVRGQRYLWRVWPYIGARKRFTATVKGQSWFSVSPRAKLVVKRAKKPVTTRTATKRTTRR